MKCTVCQKEIDGRHDHRRISCNDPECKREIKRRRERIQFKNFSDEKKARKREHVREYGRRVRKAMPPKKCKLCDELLVSHRHIFCAGCLSIRRLERVPVVYVYPRKPYVPKINNCAVCGIAFSPGRGGRKTCSEECSADRSTMRMVSARYKEIRGRWRRSFRLKVSMNYEAIAKELDLSMPTGMDRNGRRRWKSDLFKATRKIGVQI